MLNKSFDALVIGSGASGSFAAKELTERGLEVLLLEAGPNITEDDFKSIADGPKQAGIQPLARARAALKGQYVQARTIFYSQQLKRFFVNDWQNPYSTPSDAPYLWIRGRQLGGRLHVYGRVLLRWSDYDFKASSRDGHGQDWPISYADLAPYYDRVEDALGLYGNRDGVASLPDGNYIKKPKLTAVEEAFKARVEANWPNRSVVSWRYMPPNPKRVPQPLLAARATGLLTERADAIVRQITTDPVTGKPTGAEFIDRRTKQAETVSAKVVVLCASPIESVRLLLNSKSARHPNGLGNSSGLLGRYFMDHIPSLTYGTVPGVTGWEQDDTLPDDPIYGSTGGVCVTRFENLGRATNSKFLGGFRYEGTIGRHFVDDDQPARFGFMGFGEMLPNPDNRVTLHPWRKDAWGIPIPHIRCAMSRNERELLREQIDAMVEMAEKAGLEVQWSGSPLGLEEKGKGAFPNSSWLSRLIFRLSFKKSMMMGSAVHECGGARMGSDPATSILNAYNQCWDAKNLLVTDASSFPSSGTAGTTLTIMALTVRACEHIANEFKAGRL